MSYSFWTKVLFETVIPLLAVLFLNGFIVTKINGGMNLQRTLSRQEDNAIKILLCIVSVFLILHIPRVVYKVMYFLGYKKVDSWH